MLNLIFFGLLLVGAIAENPSKFRYMKDFKKDSRILNGELTNINEAPYQMVALFSRGDNIYYPVCTGAIINEKVFVTVAHCIITTSPHQWRVRVGSSSSTYGGVVVDIDDFEYHMRFDIATADFDIAMLFINNPIRFVEMTILPAILPELGEEIDDGVDALLTGWGATDVDGNPVEFLRKTTVTTLNREWCEGRYADLNEVTMRMICASDVNLPTQQACVGDSGAPLVANDVLIGLASWGMGCGLQHYPGVFTRVASFVMWIDHHQPDSNHTMTSSTVSTTIEDY